MHTPDHTFLLNRYFIHSFLINHSRVVEPRLHDLYQSTDRSSRVCNGYITERFVPLNIASVCLH